MAESKQRIKPVLKGTSPKGVLVFPYLNKPDDKFKALGEYRAKLRLSAEAAAEFLPKLEKAHEDAMNATVVELQGKAKDEAAAKKITRAKLKIAQDGKPWKVVEDEEGNPTGELDVTFKKNAAYKDKKTEEVKPLKIDLFDAALQKWPKGTMIYGGSTAKIAFEAKHWYTPALGAGLKLELCGVQIIDLVTGGGARTAEQHGFGVEGDGLPTDTSGEESDKDGEAGGESDDF